MREGPKPKILEGLRLLAWFQEFLHRNQTSLLSDCAKCMQATTQINRQGRGCGYEPAAPDGVPVQAWQPPYTKLGYRHARPKICAGYTTRLPEVIEIVRAHAHWSKAQLLLFLGGEQPSEVVLDMIEILDSEIESLKVWAVTSIANGGGRA